jgi:F0F1-type ATP synthase epsilon subunit
MLVKLGCGPLRLDTAEGPARRFALDGGFAQVRHNKLVLITERATEQD